jgi:hypothetical protein
MSAMHEPAMCMDNICPIGCRRAAETSFVLDLLVKDEHTMYLYLGCHMGPFCAMDSVVIYPMWTHRTNWSLLMTLNWPLVNCQYTFWIVQG